MLSKCRDTFIRKAADYGTSWRIFRPESVTDQIFIKAKRIRTIQEKGVQKVEDPVVDDYIGLFNYSVMGVIQLEGVSGDYFADDVDFACDAYEKVTAEIGELYEKKNHDYGEAWRDLRLESIVDLILVKLIRIRQIETNGGVASSEGERSNYMDIANYALFSMILMQEQGD